MAEGISGIGGGIGYGTYSGSTGATTKLSIAAGKAPKENTQSAIDPKGNLGVNPDLGTNKADKGYGMV